MVWTSLVQGIKGSRVTAHGFIHWQQYPSKTVLCLCIKSFRFSEIFLTIRKKVGFDTQGVFVIIIKA